MIDAPVFVAGLDRTGKTPMRIAIEESGAVALFRRGELWTHHFERYGDLADDHAAERAVAGLLADRHVAAQISDAPRLERELMAGPRTYAALFALIGRQLAERRGRHRWGDQTALLERRAGTILAAYPAARIVHMVRDPRDRYADALMKSAVGPGGIAASCAAWRESVELGITRSRAHPDRYLLVRYEDLALEPDATLDRVFAFLDIQPSPPGAGSRVSEALATGIGLHRRVLRHRQIAFIQEELGEPMTTLRYSVDPTPLGILDRLRLNLVDRPAGHAITMFRRRPHVEASRPGLNRS